MSHVNHGRLEFGPEDSEGAGVAVQEGGAAHRTDLSIAEEPPQGHRPQLFLEERKESRDDEYPHPR